MPLFIRSYASSDVATLARLLRRSVALLGPKEYSDEQVAAWLKRLPDAEDLHRMSLDGRTVLIAASEDDEPVAFTHLEADGHIHYFFCAPEYAGQGVGGALYDALEKVALEIGLKRLYVEASEAARRLFLRKGFNELHRRDFQIEGVDVHNYAMEKSLLPL